MTLLLPLFATQMLEPSNAIPSGAVPTVMEFSNPPVEPNISLTVFPLVFVIQTFRPSQATAEAPTPAGNVPRFVPSPARNFRILAVALFVIQTLEPSKATPVGLFSPEWTVPLAWLAAYQCNVAICMRFGPGGPWGPCKP